MIDTLPSLIAAVKACTVACTIALSPSIGSFRVANTGAHAPVTIDLGGQEVHGQPALRRRSRHHRPERHNRPWRYERRASVSSATPT